MQLKVWTKNKNGHKIKYYVNELYIGYKGLLYGRPSSKILPKML